MSEARINMIKRYHGMTPFYEVSLWGLRGSLCLEQQEVRHGLLLPWDYGLDVDCQLLCRHRSCGRLPCEFIPLLWAKLQVRKQELSEWSTSVV